MSASTQDSTDGSVIAAEDQDAVERFNGTPDADVGEAAGQSIEDITAEGVPEDEEGQTLLDFGDQLNLAIKGKRPTISKVKVKSIAREIKGQLGDKGDDERVYVLVEAQLDETSVRTFRNDEGRVMRKERRHTLTPIGVTRIPEEDALSLIDDFAG